MRDPSPNALFELFTSFKGPQELVKPPRGTLQRLYSLQRIHKEVRPTSQLYLATQPAVTGKAAAPELLMRAVYLSKVSTEAFAERITDSLDIAFEEVEHAAGRDTKRCSSEWLFRWFLVGFPMAFLIE